MRHIPEPILIFSVYRDTESQETNEVAHYAAMAVLEGAKAAFIELDGFYNRQREKSFLLQGWELRGLIETLCHAYKQECYLEAHGDRFATLCFQNGERRNVGYIVAVSEEEAKASATWSYNPIAGYFVTKQSRQGVA